MPLPTSVIGTELPAATVVVERGQLAFFAETTGCTDPIYRRLDAALAAGHPDLPVPPTFLFGLGLDRWGAGALWLSALLGLTACVALWWMPAGPALPLRRPRPPSSQ